ncbi:glycoside hydrolase family 2 TIM barrel-domain containing protein [Sinomicrobium soli]|uniref:glycoside hydrolase family 2 TIM barrel-domain containing protein n=1 Tax=Sinomicrobium sp. N-1-3-6 TaxID=2219864 RepID=UPI00191C0036|nr:glycoside hydrolase family 2 TIM barrel-domain containing protein [Sinomicrobium sp. N-1-3-6]
MRFMLLLLTLALACTSVIYAQDDTGYQRIYLSGRDAATPVEWDFKVSDGRKSGKWSRIPVPSNWELHGFGTYNYGHDHGNDERVLGKETGFYKYRFRVPDEWKGKTVNIVFAGSMTDTEVKINGRQAGPVHQGAFYEFKYDISSLLEFGKKNLLEVKVAKHSENASVNRAERQADFWIFGGIFRPVYLEILPEAHFSRIAVDARASGKFRALLELSKPVESAEVRVRITDRDTGGQVKEFTAPLDAAASVIEEHVEHTVSWNPENPRLYDAEFTLLANGKPVYTKVEHIGFRTVALRENDGFYVNGTRVVFKGVNRHSFYPTTGRALSEANHLEDIRLIKEMNMNAVRMSHYPPDERFLELCDSLGLFVLDEVTGWQDGYDTIAGPKLIRETILKDENHPSVVIWDHGNEGGWTFANEKWFHRWDIQKRPVIYPWLNRNGVDTFHYPVYKAGINRLSNGQDVFMPTEMIHGLYDGGHGAGLDDFWTDYMKNPRAAGGFLWAFADEAVVRTDRSDSLDADGNHGPDGIVGPFREKEGSFYTIRDIWSPVKIKPLVVNSLFDGQLILGNDYLYTDLEGMELNWKLKAVNDWEEHIMQSGDIVLKSTLPGESSRIELNLPEDFARADWLEVQVTDHHGRVVNTWSWPVHTPFAFAERNITAPAPEERPEMGTEGDKLVFRTGEVKVYFDKNNYVLEKAEHAGWVFPLSGPVFMKNLRLEKVNIREDEAGNHVIALNYDGYPDSVTWTLFKNGIVKLEAAAFRGRTDGKDYIGIHFDFPEEQVRGIKWFGNGPYRVWQNRLRGARFGFWQKDYNNTITGYSTKGKLEYPEFKGYHAGLYAYRLSTQKGDFSVYTETSGLFFRLFTPDESPYITDGLKVSFPPGDLSFLQKIPPIGTKFHAAEFMGPESGNPRNVGHWGDRLEGITLYFDFR